ncbi:MAG: cyclic nucleotide-binding domain-containing protein [Nitrospinota bacterium]
MKDLEKNDKEFLVGIFRGLELFSCLSDQELYEIFEEMGEAQYHSGEKIIEEGDPPDFIFIIKEGEVDVTQKKFFFKTVKLGTLQPGDIFGEMAILSYGPRMATCTATKETVCFLMFKSTFHYMLKYHPDFKKHVEELSAQRTLGSHTK